MAKRKRKKPIRRKKANNFRVDPSGTGSIRRPAILDIRRRYTLLAQRVQRKIVDENYFEAQQVVDTTPDPGTLWNAPYPFTYNTSKIQDFKNWLQKQIDSAQIYDPDEHLRSTRLEDKSLDKYWSDRYVGSAYRQGVIRAYMDAAKSDTDSDYDVTESLDFYRGTREGFLSSSFNGPVAVKSLELLSTRAYDQLKGIDAQLAQNISRELTDGFLKGLNPRDMARNLRRQVEITKNRAETIARTEIIHAHAEGQLDSYEALGVDTLEALTEWSTAGDDDVCEECDDLEGKVFTVQDARGLIPLHPNCRCTWIPAAYGTKMSAKQLQQSKETAEQLRGHLDEHAEPAIPLLGRTIDDMDDQEFAEYAEEQKAAEIAVDLIAEQYGAEVADLVRRAEEAEAQKLEQEIEYKARLEQAYDEVISERQEKTNRERELQQRIATLEKRLAKFRK